MSSFDANAYFQRKAGNPITDKQNSIQQGLGDKYAALDARTKEIKAQYEQHQNSWAGKLGLDSESFAGEAVNLGASFVSGASRVAGQIAEVPLDIMTASIESQLNEEDVQAYNRYTQGTASEEDTARLHSRKRGQVPPIQLIQQASESRAMSRKVDSAFDLTGIVSQDKRNQLTADLGNEFGSSWDQTKQGWDKLGQTGNRLSGLGDVVSGVGKLTYNAGEAAITNPAASSEYITENIPQLGLGLFGKAGKAALAVSNAGYGSELYQEGITNYQTVNKGQLPPEELRREMQMNAAGASLMEQASDAIVLGVSKLGKGAATPISRTGFKESLKNVGKATGTGLVSESVTEGVQTYLEGEATLKPASAKDVYVGASIGGIAGAGMSGGGRAIAEGAKATPEQAQKREQDRLVAVDHQKAVETNDTTAYLDKESKTYNPTKAVEVLIGNSQLETTTPEDKAESITKANQIVTDLEAQAADIRTGIENSEPELVAVHQGNIALLKEAIANSDPTDTVGIEKKTKVLEATEMLLAEVLTPEQIKKKEQELNTLERHITGSRQAKLGLNLLVQPKAEAIDADIELADSTPNTDSNAAVSRVLTLSMASPGSITPEVAKRLADNTSNALTAEQRDYFRVFSDARIAENKLKDMEKVSQDIYLGSKEKGKQRQLGIANYNTLMGEAIAAGNEKEAKRHLAGLTEFARNHQSKVAAAELALKTVKGRQPQIIFNKDSKNWEVSSEQRSDPWMKANGGFTLSTKQKAVDTFKTEADALNKSTAALKSAFELKFTKPVAVSSTPVVTPAVSTTPVKVNLGGTNRYAAKDQAKSDQATKFIGRGSVNSSTERYAKAWGDNANSSNYTPEDIVFVSAEGARLGRKDPDFKELGLATAAQATIITDGIADRTRNYNSGERQVAEFLVQNNYKEGKPGIWKPPTPVNSSQSPTDSANQSTTSKSSQLQPNVDTTVDPVVKSTEVAEAITTTSTTTEQDAPVVTEFPKTEEVTSEEDGEPTSATESVNPSDSAGKLEVLQRDPAPKGTLLKEVSALGLVSATYFKQSSKREGDTTARPLAAVKDFFSNWLDPKNTDVSMYSFLSLKEGETTPEQDRTVKAFRFYTKQWLDTIRESLVVGSDKPEYAYNDPIQEWLITGEDGKPDLPENVKTAMAYTAVSWIQETTRRSAANTDEGINALLNRNEDDEVLPFERELLKNVTSRKATLANQLGQRTLQALGISDTPDTPMNLKPMLEATLGTHVIQLLLKESVIEYVEISSNDIRRVNAWDTGEDLTADEHEVKQAREVREGYTKQDFISVIRDEKRNLGGVAQAIAEASRGSLGILDQLFSVESGIMEPTLEPVDFTQTHTKSGNEIPKELADTLQKDNHQPNTLKQDSWNIFSDLSEDAAVKIASGEWVTEGETQAMLIDGIEARNEGLRRDIRNVKDFITFTLARGKDGFATAIYFSHDVWNQYRVGISNNINPQMSKVVRGMFQRDGWEAKVDTKKPEQFNQFKLRVLEGLKVPTNNEANAKSLLRMQDLFRYGKDRQGVAATEAKQFDLIDAAVDAMVQRMDGDPMSPAMEEAILNGNQAGGSQMHTFDVLVALATLRFAQKNDQTTFKTSVMGEIDGVSNGPIAAHLMFGAAANEVELAKFLKKGGFYSLEDAETEYNLWRSQGNNLDLYEGMTAAAIRVLAVQKADSPISFVFEAVEAFVGDLQKADGGITSAGRNLSKDPIRPLIFGSSKTRAIESMSQSFVENVAKKLQKLSEDKQEIRATVRQLNTLLYGSTQLPLNISRKELVAIVFDKDQKDAIRNSFKRTFGESYKEAVNTELETFLERRAQITRASSLVFELYNAAYQSLRNEYIDSLVAKGKLDIGKDGKASHDLTHKQEKAFQKSIKDLMPMMHTVMSKSEDNLAAGLPIFKSKNKLSQDRMYTAGVHLPKNENSRGSKNSRIENIHGTQRVLESSGVNTVSMPIHAQDSTASHRANPEGKRINLHDAQGTGLDDFLEMGRSMNEALWTSAVEYSPIRELSNTLQRTIQSVAGLLQRNSSMTTEQRNALLGALAPVLAEYALDNDIEPQVVIQYVMDDINYTAHTADTNKLGMLASTAVVAQYASEGAGYTVTPENRASVVEKQAELTEQNTLDAKTNTGISLISNMTEAKVTEYFNDLSSKASLKKFNKLLNKLPVNKLKQLMRAVILNKETDAALRKEINSLRQALGEDKSTYRSVQDASGFSNEKLSEIVTVLGKRLEAMDTEHWGKLGKPDPKKNDATLVELFEGTDFIKANQLLDILKERFANSKVGMPAFNLALIERLSQLIKSDLKVVYVTKATDPSLVMSKPAIVSTGWYSLDVDKNEIYILGKDFKDSAITPELVLHELSHAALAKLIQSEENKPEGSKPTETSILIDELKGILQSAKTMVEAGTYPSEFTEAVSSLQEFVAYGITHEAFQNTILKSLSVTSPVKGNSLFTVDGFVGFVQKIVGLLFGKQSKTNKDGSVNALAIFLRDVSGLFAESANAPSGTALTQSMAATTARIDAYTTNELYQALGTGSLDPSFDEHLQGLLNGIVEKVHGAFGSFKNDMQRTAASNPLDVFQKAMDSGVAPFASQSRAAGIRMDAQVAFVMEQVEATMLAALNDNEQRSTSAATELDNLYKEVYQQVKVEDLYEGDWSLAQPHEIQETKDLYDFIFKMEKVNGNKTDHLARFAALGLTHPKFNNLLHMATKRDTRRLKDMSFNEKLKTIFERVLNWANGKLTHTKEGQAANEKLATLVEQLVDIEARKKAMLDKRAKSKDYVAPIEEGARKLIEVTRSKIADIANSKFVKNNSSVFVQTAGEIASTIAEDRVIQLLDTIADYRNKNWKQNLGFTAGLLNNIRGVNQIFNALLSTAKEHERERKFIITQVSKAVLSGFADKGKNLSVQSKEAVSALLLRTGAHVLLKDFDMKEIGALVNSESALKQAIKDFETKLDTFGGFKRDFIYQAKALAYDKVTGQQKSQFGSLNAHNIARLVGTGNLKAITEAQAQLAEPIINTLVTLYALKYSSHKDRNELGKLITEENSRIDGNGVEFAMVVHRELEKQAKDKLFADANSLMVKGYMPEIYNPHTDIQVANTIQGRNLMDLGYIKGAVVEQDIADPDTDIKNIYVLPDGGNQPYLSGIIAPSSMSSKGSTQKVMNSVQTSRTKTAALRFAIDNTPDFDPSKVKQNYMTPVINPDGQAVNWRYMMQEQTKNTILERDNRPEEMLGALAGSIYDKDTIGEKNEKALQALHDQFQDKFAGRTDSFVEVGPNANDEGNREIYRLLPEATKEAIKRIWGSNTMMVPVELMDVTFGYRKLSLSTAFDKVNANRKAKLSDPSLDQFDGVTQKEHAFIFGVEYALRMYAKVHLKMDDAAADRYSLRGAVVVARAERGWQEVVKLTKDIIVVRTGTVMAANILSNLSFLTIQGVPMLEQIRHHRVGIKGAMAYQEDSQKLFDLKLKLDTGYTQGNASEIKREIIRLENAIERNPVRKLIEAGMMPTIVEDIAADTDPYSYKSAFARKMTKYTDKLNPVVRDVAKTVAVAQDTQMYKTFSQITQLSDFVARYTLYQHLTTRKTKPLSHEDAIFQASESFVNYDIPMQRKMQYMDDMGITNFTKYFLGIQRVLLKTTRENPLRVLLALALNGYMDALPLVTDGSAIAHLGNNPLRTGAFQIFGTADDLATVKGAMSLIK